MDSQPWLRCPACDYDLRGLPERRCPECGCAFDPDALRRAFHRPKLSTGWFIGPPAAAWLACSVASCATREGFEAAARWPAGQSMYWYTNGYDGVYTFCVGYLPLVLFLTAAAAVTRFVDRRIQREPRRAARRIARLGLALAWLGAAMILLDTTLTIAFFD